MATDESRMYEGIRLRNRSWPAVSHSCSRIWHSQTSASLMQCAHTHQLTLDSKAVGLMINLNFLKELKPYKNGYSLSYQQSTGEHKLHVHCFYCCYWKSKRVGERVRRVKADVILFLKVCRFCPLKIIKINSCNLKLEF